jgi:hypothetical protein
MIDLAEQKHTSESEALLCSSSSKMGFVDTNEQRLINDVAASSPSDSVSTPQEEFSIRTPLPVSLYEPRKNESDRPRVDARCSLERSTGES